MKLLLKLRRLNNFQFKSTNKIGNAQRNFHRLRFNYFFKENLTKVKGKKLLDAGCGPGVHSIILDEILKNGDNKIFSLDILNSNIQKLNKLKKKYKSKIIFSGVHDFTKKLKGNFDYVICQNWIPHSQNPEKCLINIFDTVPVNGKIYLSIYHEYNFRWLVSYIARRIIKDSDFKYFLSNESKLFKKPLMSYGNKDDIFFESMICDYFSPTIYLTNYKKIIEFFHKYGFQILNKGSFSPLHHKNDVNLDNHLVKISFVRKKIIKPKKKIYVFNNIDDYFKNNLKKNSLKDVINCSQKISHYLKKQSVNERLNFVSKIYEIRAKYSKTQSSKKIDSLFKFMKIKLDAVEKYK
jgi:2-polyprenyl-3-methyl-5-hydroxy-6-metoxy-1,4-benzoquinol methylase